MLYEWPQKTNAGSTSRNIRNISRGRKQKDIPREFQRLAAVAVSLRATIHIIQMWRLGVRIYQAVLTSNDTLQ
jgi:hypothetical protein